MAPKRRGRPPIRFLTEEEEVERPTPQTETPPVVNAEVEDIIGRIIAEKLAEAMPGYMEQLRIGTETPLRENPRTVTPNVGEGTSTVAPGFGERRNGCSHKTFKNCNPPTHSGMGGAVGATKCLDEIEAVLNVTDVKPEDKTRFAAYSMRDEAWTWWKMLMETKGEETMNRLSWAEFKKLITEKYCPNNELEKLEMEFLRLEMIGADILGYTTRFNELSRLVPHLVTPYSKRISHYIWGLAPQIGSHVKAANPTTFEKAVSLAGTLTDEMVRSGALASTKTGDKRKWYTNDHRNLSGNNWGRKMEHPVVRNFGSITAGNKPPPRNNIPPCTICNKNH